MRPTPALLASTSLAFALLALSGRAAAAQDSVGDTSAASKASVDLGGDLAASGVRTVAAAAIPPASTLAAGSAVGGSIAGGVAGQAMFTGAKGMSTVAGDLARFAQGPLPVTREVVVAQPVPRLPYEAGQAPR